MTDTTQADYNPQRGSPFVQGARATSPKEVMYRLRNSNPTSTKEELIELFKNEATNDQELTEICIEIAAINAYQAWENLLRGTPRTPRLDSASMTVQREATQRQAEAVATRIERALVLDFVMPNSKVLRDCTFKEVGKFGRGFQKIAKAGRPNQKVGEVLSEARAKALMR